eukprot:7391838-Prymnesium_polylepis.2
MIERGFIANEDSKETKMLADSGMMRARALELMARKGESSALLPAIDGVCLTESKHTCFRNIPAKIAGQKRQGGMNGSSIKIRAL